ncbi:MAG TPA: hypothetical protein VHB79_26665 [Polyangiaceae bacterium]|nr:hypothetical protein [Polyangiaceae bacterium]
MSQPEFGWDEEERALLSSAELDAPPPGAQNRTLAALGITGAALSTAATAGTAKAALSTGKSFGLGKLLTVLAIGGTAGGAALHYRAQIDAQEAPASRASAATRAAAPTTTVTPAKVAAPATDGEQTTAPAPEALVAIAKPSAPASAHSEPDIALEIAALDRARRAAESGNFSAALDELNEYDRAYKQGRLRPEALLLRIQTLISKGDSAGAKALGTRFLARYPKSPLSPRIQKLIGATN